MVSYFPLKQLEIQENSQKGIGERSTAQRSEVGEKLEQVRELQCLLLAHAKILAEKRIQDWVNAVKAKSKSVRPSGGAIETVPRIHWAG